MKKFISKVKKATKDFFTNKSAFSLVELIVVIAIMAVMAAVLAPALLGYVEKSRMQKDDSAMDEVVNAMQLSLADQEIYDEVLEHSVWDNVSCYIDKKDESQFADCKVQLKAANGDKKEQYMFGDEARLLDETVYYAAGNMRGLTITFSPSESGDTYDFANGILNKFVGRKTGILSENPELYNRLRSVIGDKLDTTSQTYRNSDYTIFIRVGSTGGSEAVMQDAIQVWGQFNGTNLAEKDHKYELSTGRIVGTAGANDATNNQTNNENVNVNFSEIKTMTIRIDGQNKTYQYKDGMTWREWINSEYNTDSGLFSRNENDNWVLHDPAPNQNTEYLTVKYSGVYLNKEFSTYAEMIASGLSGGSDTTAYAHQKILPINYHLTSWGNMGGAYGHIYFAIEDMLEYGYYITGSYNSGYKVCPLPTDIESLPDWLQ